MIEIYNFCSYCLSLFSDLGDVIIQFLFKDFLGEPLIFYMFGAGLVVYLSAKILLELIT